MQPQKSDENPRRHASHAVPPYHPDWLLLRELNRDVRWAIESFATGTLLDVGCGGRPYESTHSKVDKWIGMDRPDNTLADVHGTATNVPLADGAVQTVLCTQVLEHLNDPAKAVHELWRVLAPQGILILSAPQYWPLHEEPYDFFRYTGLGLRALLNGAKFEVLETRSQGCGAIVAGQALNNAMLCAGDTLSFRDSLAFKASKAPFYLLVNAVSVMLGTVLKTKRDAINHLFIARKLQD